MTALQSISTQAHRPFADLTSRVHDSLADASGATILAEIGHTNGNRFLVLDERNRSLSACSRRLLAIIACRDPIRVDDLISIRPSSRGHFRLSVVGGDGREAKMCGNGLVYATDVVASQAGLAHVVAETNAGILELRRDGRGWCASMGRVARDRALEAELATVLPSELQGIQCFDSGEPHAVLFTRHGVCALEDLNAEQFEAMGRIVYQASGREGGIHLNLVAMDRSGGLRVRTFERGIRRETLACGTGVLASYAAAVGAGKADPLGGVVKTRGGSYRTMKCKGGFTLTTTPTRAASIPVEALFERHAA